MIQPGRAFDMGQREEILNSREVLFNLSFCKSTEIKFIAQVGTNVLFLSRQAKNCDAISECPSLTCSFPSSGTVKLTSVLRPPTKANGAPIAWLSPLLVSGAFALLPKNS
jgi:hypothetical protein